MSILCHDEENNLAFLSHQNYMAASVRGESAHIDKLFDIKTPFRMDAEALAVARKIRDGDERPKKKKKTDIPSDLKEEIEYLKEKLALIHELYKQKYFPGNPSIEDIEENNKNLRDYVASTMKITDEALCDTPSAGSNQSANVTKMDEYLLPPQSEFRLCEISNFDHDTTYDMILMDPPWENKHVKRSYTKPTGYTMLTNDEMRRIPIDKMLTQDGVVVIWCSNNLRHREAIREWLDHWGLGEIARWYWLKLTKHGETICQFSAAKNPYEIVIIASRSSIAKLPQELVLASVPSGIHSHKPPLSPLLDTWFKQQRRRLEIFGRYLQEGWTTIGLEACKLNHSAFYTTKTLTESVSDED